MYDRSAKVAWTVDAYLVFINKLIDFIVPGWSSGSFETITQLSTVRNKRTVICKIDHTVAKYGQINNSSRAMPRSRKKFMCLKNFSSNNS